MQKIRTLDPAYPNTSDHESGVYYHQRDYKSLIEASQRSVITSPNGGQITIILLSATRARDNLSKPSPNISGPSTYHSATRIQQQGLLTSTRPWVRGPRPRRYLATYCANRKLAYVSPYMIAAIYSGLGQDDKAFEFLEKAYQEKSPDIAYFIKADLRIDTLRSDPRFQDLLRRMNFPQ